MYNLGNWSLMFASISGQMAPLNNHFGPDLSLLFKLHNFDQLILILTEESTVIEIVANRYDTIRLLRYCSPEAGLGQSKM